eukprot:155419-Hanusia_phi.AAC.1
MAAPFSWALRVLSLMLRWRWPGGQIRSRLDDFVTEADHPGERGGEEEKWCEGQGEGDLRGETTQHQGRAPDPAAQRASVALFLGGVPEDPGPAGRRESRRGPRAVGLAPPGVSLCHGSQRDWRRADAVGESKRGLSIPMMLIVSSGPAGRLAARPALQQLCESGGEEESPAAAGQLADSERGRDQEHPRGGEQPDRAGRADGRGMMLLVLRGAQQERAANRLHVDRMIEELRGAKDMQDDLERAGKAHGTESLPQGADKA